MTIVDPHALTPVEYHDGIYFKRDDLFLPFTDIGVSGGKVRQCLLLVKKYLREITRDHAATIATACSVHSPQGVIVARVRFGYQAESDSDAILEPNAAQVRNIPRNVTALVVPVGSAVSARGILLGIERFRADLTVHLIQPFGYERKLVVPSNLKVRYLKGNYAHARPIRIEIDDFQLDRIYEAKAYDHMRRHLQSVLKRQPVCFWIIGDANGLTQRAER